MLPTTATRLWRSLSGELRALGTKNKETIVKMFHSCLFRNALEEDDNLQRVLKKAFVDADKALHRHLCHFNNGETHKDRASKEMHTCF